MLSAQPRKNAQPEVSNPMRLKAPKHPKTPNKLNHLNNSTPQHPQHPQHNPPPPKHPPISFFFFFFPFLSESYLSVEATRWQYCKIYMNPPVNMENKIKQTRHYPLPLSVSPKVTSRRRCFPPSPVRTPSTQCLTH